MLITACRKWGVLCRTTQGHPYSRKAIQAAQRSSSSNFAGSARYFTVQTSKINISYFEKRPFGSAAPIRFRFGLSVQIHTNMRLQMTRKSIYDHILRSYDRQTHCNHNLNPRLPRARIKENRILSNHTSANFHFSKK